MAELTIRRLVGGLVPFIGLLAGILALSSYLGGGTVGIALAILLAAVYLLIYGAFLHFLDLRKREAILPRNETTPERAEQRAVEKPARVMAAESPPPRTTSSLDAKPVESSPQRPHACVPHLQLAIR